MGRSRNIPQTRYTTLLTPPFLACTSCSHKVSVLQRPSPSCPLGSVCPPSSKLSPCLPFPSAPAAISPSRPFILLVLPLCSCPLFLWCSDYSRDVPDPFHVRQKEAPGTLLRHSVSQKHVKKRRKGGRGAVPLRHKDKGRLRRPLHNLL